MRNLNEEEAQAHPPPAYCGQLLLTTAARSIALPRDANESVCARGVAIARPTRVVPKTRTVRLGNSH